VRPGALRGARLENCRTHIPRFADGLQIGLGVDQQPQAGAYDRVVVDHENSDRNAHHAHSDGW
jgi:hypothetical protein